MNFLNAPQLEKYRYDLVQFWRIYLLTDKVDEPEKTTGPSGVEPSME
ncbi:MAG TPA: hypothetical protein VFK40_11720 [Nitrososphaeraceae archaeon]|nr:hypothetical protein [Nitrososphaeraceae archaeon]HET8793522.1 hypothetical protein [Nitrososphaeraceae archaeon]